MKRLLLACTLISALAGTALADSVQVDATFEKANRYLKDNNLSLTGGPSGQRDDGAAFGQEALLFYGEAVGNPAHTSVPQRGMMAREAAKVLAQRALVEYLEGFALVAATSVKDGMLQSSEVSVAVSGFVKGMQVVVQEYNAKEDTAIAIIKLGLHGPNGFASSIYEKMNKNPQLKKELSTDKPDFKATPVALDQVYDGLIIDAKEQAFRPALINRIFSDKGEVIYDPAKVSQKVLIEQGCGEYTNSVEKARAALETRCVKNPLVVKASGAVNPSDLQVNNDDAVTIFSANRKGNFMAAAKVAFVLQ
jgi:hypothetical protein